MFLIDAIKPKVLKIKTLFERNEKNLFSINDKILTCNKQLIIYKISYQSQSFHQELEH